MVELFKADIFSVSRPQFSAVSPAVDERLREVARSAYPQRLASIATIEQFGGNEINSNNFRIVAGEGVYLLKRLPASANAAALTRQLSILKWLHERQIAVPGVVLASSGECLVRNDAGYWCLFDFVPGDFYSGRGAELESTGVEIGRLQQALSTLPDDLYPPRKWDYLAAMDRETLERAAQLRPEWSAVFGSGFAELLRESWGLIAAVGDELTGNAGLIHALPGLVCHCDLHPHNILVQADRLRAFIDFESFTVMPAAAALGFATYKLMKQHAVAEGMTRDDGRRLAATTSEFVASMQRGLGSSELEMQVLRYMALAEVHRRLLVVLRLNLESGNVAWNHVLPMHIAGLQEIDLLFARNGLPRC